MGFRPKGMTAKQYNAVLGALKLTPYAAAPVLGISLRQSHRYANGEQTAPPVVAKLLDMLHRHGIPKDWNE